MKHNYEPVDEEIDFLYFIKALLKSMIEIGIDGETENVSHYGSKLERMTREAGDSGIALVNVLAEYPAEQRSALYKHALSFADDLSMLLATLSPLLPEAKQQALKLNMDANRKKRPFSEEEAIEASLRTWNGCSDSYYKLSMATSADLASRGIEISPQALRKRAEKLSSG